MSRFSLLIRHLPQRLPTATLGTARSQIVSKPNDFISALKYGERCILTPASPKSCDVLTQKRNLSTDSEDTKNEEKPLTKGHRVYINKLGEEIVFRPCKPPPGYVFVRSGNAFITRSCRKLSEKIYAVYRPESRKTPSSQIGLYVQEHALKKSESDFEAKRAMLRGELWRALDRNYPKIPPADRDELHRLIWSRCPSVTVKSALRHSEITIHDYVLDRYTPGDTIHQAHRRVQEILASWRGED